MAQRFEFAQNDIVKEIGSAGNLLLFLEQGMWRNDDDSIGNFLNLCFA
ncbi:MAG: hypothetical protein AAFY71_12215 [Bacteroidota bacterium]